MRDKLNVRLLSQPFVPNIDAEIILEQAKMIAQVYTKTENAIAVLSDLKIGRSYVYTSPTAAYLGLAIEEGIIDSIWEDELFSRIHQEDLSKKYQLEVAFFKFINTIPLQERSQYILSTNLLIKHPKGFYTPIKHRLLYLTSAESGSVWLTLCLYNSHHQERSADQTDGFVMNTVTGLLTDLNPNTKQQLLSQRQLDILKLIKEGKRSKEIASLLSLSIHTVNRHRQDIFAKLNVSNAIEACKVADLLMV